MLSPPLDEIQPNWCVSSIHIWGVQRQTVFGHAPLGPREGQKGQIFIPTLFLKKRRGYCNRLRPSVRPSVRYAISS